MASPQELLRRAFAAEKAGRPAEAAAAYREVLALRPDDASAYHHLGIIAARLQHLDEAVDDLDHAARLAPQEAGYHVALSEVQRRLKRFEQARDVAQRAIALQPGLAAAHLALGQALADLGRIAEADRALSQALTLAPRSADALSAMARLRQRQKQFGRAEALFADAIRTRPTDANLFIQFGDCLAEQDKLTGAAEAFRRARALAPGNSEASEKYDLAIFRAGGPEAARKELERAVAQSPDSKIAHRQLGDVLGTLGFLDEAAASFRRALTIDPAFHPARAALAHAMKFRSRAEADLVAIEQAYAGTGADDPAHMQLAFALGKALDDVGAYSEAFELFGDANRLARAERPYSLERDAEAFRQIRTTFTAEFIARHRGQGDVGASPIFIVGMPRSGTTLTERILAGHPSVYTCGELSFFERSVRLATGANPLREPARSAAALTGAALEQIAANYLGLLPAAARAAAHSTDKMPHNFQHIGLIRLAFPAAKIIHLMRSPVDTCLSMFKTPFASNGLGFTNDLTDLGRYYNLYRGLMQHWRAVLPGEIYDLSYEALVTDPGATTRALFDHIGLDPTDRGDAAPARQGEVQTASFAQVRRPIYKDSLDSGARYGAQLDPLRAALAEWTEEN